MHKALLPSLLKLNSIYLGLCYTSLVCTPFLTHSLHTSNRVLIDLFLFPSSLYWQWISIQEKCRLDLLLKFGSLTQQADTIHIHQYALLIGSYGEFFITKNEKCNSHFPSKYWCVLLGALVNTPTRDHFPTFHLTYFSHMHKNCDFFISYILGPWSPLN